MSGPSYWLMKAEPDSRIEKGKDVKFSIDDFEEAKTTAWEGVRNPQARNFMQSMKVGDEVCFYHSNCKIPGIAGLAKVSKESYPDYTAWDESHPYYDAKTDKDAPKWFMVDVTLTSRVKHFIPLALFRQIADSSSSDPPAEVEYIGKEGVAAIKGMALVSRGRLSVQSVSPDAWKTVNLLAEKGGWDIDTLGKKKKSKPAPAAEDDPPKSSKKRKADDESKEAPRRSSRKAK